MQKDDVIYRQAAIEALHQWFADGFEEDRWWNSTHVLAALEGLPSAQPEQRWIPCSEKLPEKEVVYIITVHCEDRNFITFDNFCSYKHGWKEWSNQEVLAWMPLPEPYREEK